MTRCPCLDAWHPAVEDVVLVVALPDSLLRMGVVTGVHGIRVAVLRVGQLHADEMIRQELSPVGGHRVGCAEPPARLPVGTLPEMPAALEPPRTGDGVVVLPELGPCSRCGAVERVRRLYGASVCEGCEPVRREVPAAVMGPARSTGAR